MVVYDLCPPFYSIIRIGEFFIICRYSLLLSDVCPLGANIRAISGEYPAVPSPSRPTGYLPVGPGWACLIGSVSGFSILSGFPVRT